MTDVKLHIDPNAKTVPTDFSWRFGIGNDHALQVLRKDVCEHLKLAHDRLGFRYVRFHGIFDDDMLCIRRMSDVQSYNVFPFAKSLVEQNFRRVASVFDNVLDCGMKPFVELSFMPSALASGDKTGLAYKNNITMPKDLTAWRDFIGDFIAFLLRRYGKEEVSEWYFEVWNEPDLDVFFDGSMNDYFALYDATALAVKSAEPSLRVGGPSTSGCKWIREFVEHCDKNGIPCDFVTTHHYPGDAFGNTVSEANVARMMSVAEECAKNGVDMGDALSRIFFSPETYRGWKKGAFIELDRKAAAEANGKPLFITEWNCSATYSVPLHDEKYSAAFVVKSALDAHGMAQGYMFWCCSDIFEETFDLGKPFHGSFGIINNDGIPKPNFAAFEMLAQLGPERYVLPITNADVECAAFTDGKKMQVLIYAQDFDYEKCEKYSVELTVDRRATHVEMQAVDDARCNPKAEWLRLGKPDVLTREQAADIKAKTALVAEDMRFAVSGEKTVIKLDIATNDVILLTIE